MGFPLELFEDFEDGTRGVFDTEQDIDNRLDFPHQRHLRHGMMPWRGAYCMRVDLGKSSADAYVEKVISYPAAGPTQKWGRFRLFVGNDVQFGNDLDYLRIMKWFSSGPTEEARLTLGRIEPLGIVLSAEEGGETWDENTSSFKIPVGAWLTVEFRRRVDDDVAGASSTSLMLPRVGWLASDRRVEGDNVLKRVGAVDQTGDIQGTIYFDEVIIDEDRLWSDDSGHNGRLSGESLMFVKSGFAFIGPGLVEHVSLIDGGSGDCRVKIYDLDEPKELAVGSIRENLATLANGATEQSRGPGFTIRRGCYVELIGTNPQALVRLGKIESDDV